APAAPAASSTEAFIESLRARLGEMEARVEAGRVLEADALKIRLDLESAELDRIRLAENRGVALAELERAVAACDPVEPEWDGSFDRDVTASAEESVEQALDARADVRALEASYRAALLQVRAVRSEALPRLEAVASWQVSDGDPFRPEELGQAGVNLSWAPFAARTRAPRTAAARAEAAAIAADLDELRRAIRVDVRGALSDLATSREALRVRERGVELASETLRVERERNAAGRSTVNDLLDAEASLRNQRTLRDLAQLDILGAWVRYDLVLGAWSEAP
ncbi:MAG: TolC family protein, partial [Acidobacteriota bacterium]